MMNVGIDISQVVYEGSGSARYVVKLVEALKAIKGDKLELTLFGSAYRRRLLLDEYKKYADVCKFYPFPPRFFELLWNRLHVVNFEEFAGSVDIYHSSDWTQAPSRAKKVTTVHDLIPFLFPEYVHPRIRNAHRDRWNWIKREVDCVIVDAESTKRDILNRFDFKEERLRVIPLGVESRFLDVGIAKLDGSFAGVWEQKMDPMLKLGLEYEKYILCVGTMEPRKNLSRLVEAYAKLSLELRREYKLVIVGKPSWMKEISIPSGVEIVFTGYVADEVLPYLYAGAKLFVMPSLYEGFGIPVLEAMASGVSVLASNLSSLPEIGHEYIKYFQSVNDVDTMSEDLTKALLTYPDGLTTKANERARLMRWEDTARRTMEVYTDIYREV